MGYISFVRKTVTSIGVALDSSLHICFFQCILKGHSHMSIALEGRGGYQKGTLVHKTTYVVKWVALARSGQVKNHENMVMSNVNAHLGISKLSMFSF